MGRSAQGCKFLRMLWFFSYLGVSSVLIFNLSFFVCWFLNALYSSEWRPQNFSLCVPWELDVCLVSKQSCL